MVTAQGAPPETIGRGQRVSLYTDLRQAPPYTALVNTDGTFRFHSVAPGTYWYRAYPWTELEPLSFAVPEGRPQRVTIDVVVK